MESINIRDVISEREYEIMVLVTEGKLNKEIADFFKLELCTIKKHLQNIYPKLKARNRSQAIIKFMELTGKINPEG